MRANAATTPCWQSDPDLLASVLDLAPALPVIASSDGHGGGDRLAGIATEAATEATTAPRTRKRTFQDLLDLLATPSAVTIIPCGEAAVGREIILDANETRVIDEAVAALATRDIYQRGGVLVEVALGTKPPRGITRPANAPRIAQMQRARIQELLSAAASWHNKGDEEMKDQHPPKWVIDGVVARPQWPSIRAVEAVVESPVLRPDGTILQTPGYDEATGLLYQPNAEYPRIPTVPTPADAMAANEALVEVVKNFPFAKTIHKAGWLAAVLTLLARYAIDGPAPMFAFDANAPGVGKGLLVDVTAIIGIGREPAVMPCPKGDEEMRKRILGIALAGELIVKLDNLDGPLMFPSLNAALTTTTWSDRILSESKIASSVPLFATWFATGNNVILGTETARRTVQIRLHLDLECPDQRSDFDHKNLLAWVRQERPRLTTAALTILSAYCAAGRKPMALPDWAEWGSFKAWSDLVRNAVAWVGMGDIGENRKALAMESDQEKMAILDLLRGLHEIDEAGVGMSVAEILRKLDDPENSKNFDTLRGALFELCPPKDGEKLNPRSVGQKFRRLKGRVVGERFLENRDEHHTAVWRVGGGMSGKSGMTSSPEENGKYKCTLPTENKAVLGVMESQTTQTTLTTQAGPAAECPLFGSHRYENKKNGDGRTKVECKCGKFYGYERVQ